MSRLYDRHRKPRHQFPYTEPDQHFRFTDEGTTNDIVAGRRISSYFIPIARPKKQGKQLVLETEWTEDRIEENRFVNRVRERVKQWRTGGYVGVTATTRRLLSYWTDPRRERKLFFCQIAVGQLPGGERKGRHAVA